MCASLAAGACTSISETMIGGGGSGGTGGGGSGGTGGAPDQSGVPCDVATVLASNCLSCHGAKTSGGAPMPLVTYDELTGPSLKDASTTVIERCVIRMSDAAAPMPPNGTPNAADIAVLQAWIDAGTPKGECGTPPVDPFSNPAGCETGKTWTSNQEGPQMNPGMACISCHKAEGEGPLFRVAGTVYGSGHETDKCYGVNGNSPDFADVVIEITDANNVVSTLKPGATGNFSLEKSGFAYPYKARVVSSKGERVMNEAQNDGDCNGCHTEAGGGKGSLAPGRIVIPL